MAFTSSASSSASPFARAGPTARPGRKRGHKISWVSGRFEEKRGRDRLTDESAALEDLSSQRASLHVRRVLDRRTEHTEQRRHELVVELQTASGRVGSEAQSV